jgi:hypothetical protein
MNLDQVNPKADDTAEQEYPPSPWDEDFVSDELEFEDGEWQDGKDWEDEDWDESEEWEEQEARPYNPSRGRRVAVVVAGVILAGTALILAAMTFMQGSWGHNYSPGEPLDHESRARIEEIRDRVAAYGTMPEVVAWLDEALAPDIACATANQYLLAAQESLAATGEPEWVEAAGELRSIMGGYGNATVTVPPLSTLEGFDTGD